METKVYELNGNSAWWRLVIVAIATAALIGMPLWTGQGDWHDNMHYLTLLLVFAVLNTQARSITVDADMVMIAYRRAFFFKEVKRFKTANLQVRRERDTLYITDRKMHVMRLEKRKLKDEAAFEELFLLLGTETAGLA